jgi:hypothetical protein
MFRALSAVFGALLTMTTAQTVRAREPTPPDEAVVQYQLEDVEPADFVRFHTEAEAELRRNELVASIWPDGLPTERASHVQLIGSRDPIGYAIVYRGHDDRPLTRTVAALAKIGYAVAEVSLPDTDHDTLFDVFGTKAMTYFLNPVVRLVNEFTARNPNAPVVMIGLSGGGWATQMSAAIDPRIDVSFPVAGSLPLYARPFSPDSEGDAEQHWPAIFAEADSNGDGVPDTATGSASWLEIYALGAGLGRRQVQIFNAADPCCFSGEAWRSYSWWLMQTVVGWSVYIDRTTELHEISPDTLNRVVIPVLTGTQALALVGGDAPSSDDHDVFDIGHPTPSVEHRNAGVGESLVVDRVVVGQHDHEVKSVEHDVGDVDE